MRRKKRDAERAGIREWAALAMVAILLQGMGLTLLHLDFERHYVCAEHARITHDADHAGADEEGDGHSVDDSREDGQAPGGDESAEPCAWLVLFQSRDDVHPGLQPEVDGRLALPASETSAVAEPGPRASRVPLYRVAPSNSPPVA